MMIGSHYQIHGLTVGGVRSIDHQYAVKPDASLLSRDALQYEK